MFLQFFTLLEVGCLAKNIVLKSGMAVGTPIIPSEERELGKRSFLEKRMRVNIF